MKIGTKSLLFGAHQFILHPFLVFIGWCVLYGFPFDPRVWFCIVVHDWGYFGSPNMDGKEGEKHPYAGASIAGALFGRRWYDFCVGHSRHLAKSEGLEVSKLCYADKLGTCLMPPGIYLPLANLSGEIEEYRHMNAKAMLFPADKTDREWYAWVRGIMGRVAFMQEADASAYVNPGYYVEAGMPEELTAVQISDACMTVDHGFGLLDQEYKEIMLRACRDWYKATRKAILDPVPDPAVKERLPGG
jgi:hypothetical protein